MINEMDNTHAVMNIAVHPHYRNQGIGSQLHNHLMDYANFKSIKTIEAYVKERLRSAFNFAQNRGFYTALYAWQMMLDVNNVEFKALDPLVIHLALRQATIKDNDTYAYIINQVFGDPQDNNILGQLLKDPSVRVYILEKKGVCIGSVAIQLKTSLSLGYIYDVAILQPYRGNGFGSYMLTQCLKELQTYNIATATLTVTGEKKQALGLYQKLGFQESDREIILGKNLKKI